MNKPVFVFVVFFITIFAFSVGWFAGRGIHAVVHGTTTEITEEVEVEAEPVLIPINIGDVWCYSSHANDPFKPQEKWHCAKVLDTKDGYVSYIDTYIDNNKFSMTIKSFRLYYDTLWQHGSSG